MGAGSVSLKSGLAIHVYLANASMKNKAIYNSDGDFLFGKPAFIENNMSSSHIFFLIFASSVLVPQQGTLDIQTELGWLEVSPGEIAIIPRGVVFRVDLNGPSRGYILEVYSGHFKVS